MTGAQFHSDYTYLPPSFVVRRNDKIIQETLRLLPLEAACGVKF